MKNHCPATSVPVSQKHITKIGFNLKHDIQQKTQKAVMNRHDKSLVSLPNLDTWFTFERNE